MTGQRVEPIGSPVPADRRRVFMVGCARTGSTLLRQILNRSDQVAIASETHFMTWAAREGLERRLAAARLSRRAADDNALRDLTSRFYAPGSWEWVGRHVPPGALQSRLAASDLSLRAVFAILMDLYAEGQGKDQRRLLVGEKTPAHLYHVRTLVDWFPDAKILHTFRDPRAIYHSELRRRRDGRWGPKARHGWLPARVIDPLLAPVQAAHTTKRWLDAVRFHEGHAKSLAGRYRLVRFEDLVTRPDEEMRQVCEFLGIPFQAHLLSEVYVIGSSFEKTRHGASGITPDAANRWASAVHPLAASWFSRVVGRQLRTFGYEP